jgi:diketogulonate reductase-like aldo/keto reductase
MHRINANGANMPCLGLGTWTLEGRHCTEMVAHALDIGYRHVDTAASYGNEEAVGAGIRASGVARDDVFVTTKVWHTDLRARDFRRSAEASLERLGLNHVDLLLIHWPKPSVPLAETIDALNKAREDGLTRNIGVSNFPTALLAEARRLSPAPLACNQVEYHPKLDQKKVARRAWRWSPIARCFAAALFSASQRSRMLPGVTERHPRRLCCVGIFSRTASRRSRAHRRRSGSPRISISSASR